MKNTRKIYILILAAALYLQPTAQVQATNVTYDFVPVGPNPNDVAASITINNNDKIVAATFSDTKITDNTVTQGLGETVTVTSNTISFAEFTIPPVAIISPGGIVVPNEAIYPFALGGFINPNYVAPAAPDSMSTWAVLITTVGGLIFLHRRLALTARA